MTSFSAGASRCSSRSPASVGATLRVVRFNRRTPSRSSRSRIRWLRLDADIALLDGRAPEIAMARHG